MLHNNNKPLIGLFVLPQIIGAHAELSQETFPYGLLPLIW